MQKMFVFKILLFIFIVQINISCGFKASITDLNIKDSSNLSNVIKMDKISVDLTQVTLTEGSVAVINIAVNPIRTVDTLIHLSLTSNSSSVRFNPIPTQITIPAGMTSKSVILNTIDDPIIQNQEIWYFNISSADSSIQADPGQLIITLNDNDGGYIPSPNPVTNIPKLLKDFNLMPASAINGIEYHGKVIYAGTDAANGQELWISDGTALGTYLIKDINPGMASSSPSGFMKDENSNYVYFTATTQSEGIEVWRTDGTANGTILLQDTEPGIGNSSPSMIYTKGSKMFFIAHNSTVGNELYITDGTIAGTSLLKEIAAGTGGISGAIYFVYFNNQIYFTTGNSANIGNYELWKTDGTSAGTNMVLNSDSNGFQFASISNFQEINGKLLMSANTNAYGPEPYTSDGVSSSNMILLKDIKIGVSGSFPILSNFILNSKLVFFASFDSDSSLGYWLTDGTPAGTVKVNTPAAPSFAFGMINDKLIFTGQDAPSGTELWTTDGTTAGTVLIKDINPGTVSSTPQFVAQIGNKIFFIATTATEGAELWVTDGTTAGTFILSDINPGSGSSNVTNSAIVGSNLIFRAYSPSYGSEFWISDGTSAGTKLLKDINPGGKSSGPTTPISIDSNHILFAAYNPTTQFPTVFTSDLTTNGTTGISHALVESGDSKTVSITGMNGLAYFDAVDDTTGNSLWVSDGTSANTSKIKDLYPNITCSDFSDIYNFNGSLFFGASTATTGRELIISDGTTSGTKVLKDINNGSGTGITNSKMFAIAGTNKILFAGDSGSTGAELWVTDGTTAGTSFVADLLPGSLGSTPSNYIQIPGTTEVLFQAMKADYRSYVYITDGTSANTSEITGFGAIYGGPTFTKTTDSILIKYTESPSYKDKLFSYDKVAKTVTLLNTTYMTDLLSPGPAFYSKTLNLSFYYTSDSASTVLSLWKTDGTTGGTTLIKNISTSGNNFTLKNFIDTGSKVLFLYKNTTASGIYELWETDGTTAGTKIVKTLNGDIFNTILFGDRYIFSSNDSSNGVELWISDGTSSGTYMVKDINSGAGSSYPENFTLFNGKVYFTANDGIHGIELWRTDGTLMGTEMVYDINPGISNSSPVMLTPIGGSLYFKATKVLSGQEVWAYTP